MRFLERLWCRLERATEVATDAAEVRRRKTSLVVIALLSCVTGLISVGHSLAAGSPLSHLAPPVVFIGIIAPATLSFLWTKRLALLLYPFLVLTLFVPVWYFIQAFQRSRRWSAAPRRSTRW